METIIDVDLKELFTPILKKYKFIKNPRQEKTLNNTWLGDNYALRFKCFRFIEFYDGSIWSDFHKTFVDEMVIEFYILAHNPDFAAKLDQLLKAARIEEYEHFFRVYITSCSIANSMDITDEIRRYDDKEVLAGIPDGVVSLLKTIATILPGYEMNAIRKFPTDLQKELDEHDVTYRKIMPYFSEIGEIEDNGSSIEGNEWYKKSELILSRKKVDYHRFANQCLGILIKMKTNEEIMSSWVSPWE